jgi:hypothetical protein
MLILVNIVSIILLKQSGLIWTNVTQKDPKVQGGLCLEN